MPACAKLLAGLLLPCTGRYFVELMVLFPVLIQAREHLFAAVISRSSSVTSRCAKDVAFSSHHKEVEVNDRCPSFG